MDEEKREEILDSPLIVHKESDASYQEIHEDGMSSTHIDDDGSDVPTLERHRFRKEKKKRRAPVYFAVLLFVVAVLLAVFVGQGKLNIGKTAATETTTTRKSYTTQPENSFEKTITVKGTYIFFEGKEVDGYEGLERKIKYLDEGTTLIVQDEDADSNLLNFEILSLLSKYQLNYEIKHVVSSGLTSKFETTTTTTKKKEKSKTKKTEKETSKDSDSDD